MIYRPYDPGKDEKAIVRVWQECGWFKSEVKEDELAAFRRFAACGSADVAELNGEAECLVLTAPGTIRLAETDLPFRAVTAVTVSRLLRQQGAAGELTARAVARAARDGEAVAGLGIFDQGFYDKLGFGNFPYDRFIRFDPAALRVPRLERVPVRLGYDDLPRIHANIQERRNGHGLVRIHDEGFTALSMREEEDCFGLGFEDEQGKLTHHLWMKPKEESGPYDVWWTVYRTPGEFVELLAVLRSLADQVVTVKMVEPPGIQIQDFLKRPFRTIDQTEGGKHQTGMKAASWRQARILDMPKTLAALSVSGGPVRFRLDLTDPLERYLPGDESWRGLAGSWTITLDGDGSRAERGAGEDLPLMNASVNAFTRLIFGVVPATGLAVSDDLAAPGTLLEELDRAIRLPKPEMVLEF